MNENNFRIARLNSKSFSLYDKKLTTLVCGEIIYWKYSHILEPWIELYNQQELHIGTLPEDVFKREFLFYNDPNLKKEK